MPESNGTINSISVVIGDDLWGSEIGDLIEKSSLTLFKLPQMEPIFDLKQIPTSVFSGFIKFTNYFKSRPFSEEGIPTYKNKYKMQLIVDLNGSKQKLKTNF